MIPTQQSNEQEKSGLGPKRTPRRRQREASREDIYKRIMESLQREQSAVQWTPPTREIVWLG